MTMAAVRPRFGQQCALLILLAGLSAGCNRTFYREAADIEVRALVDEKSNDPRWDLPGFTIDVDPRSRYANVHDQDFPPMPPDDPASHELMHCIDGKRGYNGWHDYGETIDLENPWWREAIGQYGRITPDGKLILSIPDSVRIARIHSPDYQEQLETIYLSSLDVSTERFRFDTQFVGGTTAAFNHVGSKRAGGESNRVSLNTGGEISRSLSAAGELLVGFANNTVWEFTGPNQGFTTSLLNFSFVQPLLRAGGRAVALERLTIAERTLLANLRSMERYRQGFYGTVVYGDGGAGGPQRRGGFFGAGLEGFTGQGSGGFAGVGTAAGFGRGFGGAGGGGGGTGFAGGGVGNVQGFVGLLQTMQNIRNNEASLSLQLRTLALLEANLEAGLVNLAQVDQFRQSIETQRAQLLQARNGLQASLDSFKRGTLGLPPNLPVELDESYIEPFQLIDSETSAVQMDLDSMVVEFGNLPPSPEVEQLRSFLDRIAASRDQTTRRVEATPPLLKAMDDAVALRYETMDAAERETYSVERERLSDNLQLLFDRVAAAQVELGALYELLSPDSRAEVAERIIVLLTELQSIINDTGLLQARARIETITVDPIDLTPEVALEIARANRLDWMNNRAALVDVWRLIEFNANRLKSDITIGLSGDMQTVRDNPLSFDENGGTLRASLQIDPPFTRLVERNVFRQQLIEYQQSRRRLIQYEDGVHQGLRQLLRELEQLRVNLEIQRRSVAIASRRLDQTRESLNRPIPPPQPGQPAVALGPTVAQDLLFALRDLATAQDSMMSVWISYEANVMRLYRELGIMQLDDNGLWIRTPIFAAERATPGQAPLPPPVPQEWMDAAGAADEGDGGAPLPGPALLPPAENAARIRVRTTPDTRLQGAAYTAPPVRTAGGSAFAEVNAEPARVSISGGQPAAPPGPDVETEPEQRSPLSGLGGRLLSR